MEPNNPAGRLLRILTSPTVESQKGANAYKAWAAILGVSEADKPLLMKRIGEVMGLVHDIREATQDLTGIDPKHLVAWIPNFLRPWNDMNLNHVFSHFLAPVDAAMLSLLRITDDMLSRQKPEPVIKPAELNDLRGEVERLGREVRGAAISDDLKHYLLRYIDIMDAAINDYAVKGFRSLYEGLERCVGHYGLNPDLENRAASDASGSKVLKLLGIYVAVVTGALATVQLPAEIGKYMPHKELPPAQVEHNK